VEQQPESKSRMAPETDKPLPHPPLSDSFRQLMRQMAATVTLITSEHDGHWYGMAATSVVSLTLEPPAVLFCVNRDASLYAALLARGAACINLLSREQADLCGIFGGQKRGAARFRHGEWSASHDGLPRLESAAGHIIVRSRCQFEYSSHGVFLGEVMHVNAAEGAESLIYLDGGFVTPR
jgi:flavin reductase (DIM6/NTAB) family NADH-FMN oxidoreductase RutF